jgi:hypothetical protein
MAHADFDAMRAERRRMLAADPITFRLGGETFTCRDQPPLSHLLQVGDIDDLERASLAEIVQTIADMVDGLLVDDDRPRWQEMLLSTGHDLDAVDLIELAGYLTEQYVSRPSRPPTGSSDGRHPDGDDSTFKPAGTGSARSKS